MRKRRVRHAARDTQHAAHARHATPPSRHIEQTEHRMIEFENVRFTYDGEAFVVDGVNLRIERGEFVCILGGNGSGKSTVAKLTDALLVPDEGRVRVMGEDTADATATYLIRSSAGLVFQNPDDQIVSSVIENDIAFGPENIGVPQESLREHVTRALAAVGLVGYEKRETATLSGGQKQRVAIAGVLAMDPDILILDEATAMLDPRGRASVLHICEKLHARGMTIVMITHFMEEAARAERVVVLDEGRVALDGAPRDVLAHASALEAHSLEVPFACELACELQHLGVPVSATVSEEELEGELCRLFSIA